MARPLTWSAETAQRLLAGLGERLGTSIEVAGWRVSVTPPDNQFQPYAWTCARSDGAETPSVGYASSPWSAVRDACVALEGCVPAPSTERPQRTA